MIGKHAVWWWGKKKKREKIFVGNFCLVDSLGPPLDWTFEFLEVF